MSTTEAQSGASQPSSSPCATPEDHYAMPQEVHYSMVTPAPVNPSYAFITNSSVNYSPTDPLRNAHIDDPALARRRRRRTSPRELEILEIAFRKCERPDKQTRMEIALQCDMDTRAVQVWFQNKRQSLRRRQQAAAISNGTLPSTPAPNPGNRGRPANTLPTPSTLKRTPSLRLMQNSTGRAELTMFADSEETEDELNNHPRSGSSQPQMPLTPLTEPRNGVMNVTQSTLKRKRAPPGDEEQGSVKRIGTDRREKENIPPPPPFNRAASDASTGSGASKEVEDEVALTLAGMAGFGPSAGYNG